MASSQSSRRQAHKTSERLRIGVGRPPDGTGQIEHVIGPMEPQDREVVDEAVERAADAVACLLTHGMDEAMSRYN